THRDTRPAQDLVLHRCFSRRWRGDGTQRTRSGGKPDPGGRRYAPASDGRLATGEDDMTARRVDDKAAVITGAAAGMGRADPLRLSGRGLRVRAHDGNGRGLAE